MVALSRREFTGAAFCGGIHCHEKLTALIVSRNANFADERRPFSLPEWKEALAVSDLAYTE